MTKINFDSNIKKIDIQEFNSFQIKSVNLQLNNSADITVCVYNIENDLENFIEIIHIEGDIYTNWGSDDTYIEEYVKNYLQNKYSS